MTFVEAVLLLIPILLLSCLTETILRKRLKTERRAVWASKPVNGFQRRVTLLLVAAAAAISFISSKTAAVLMPVIFAALFVFRVYMEWKHDRKSREYLITFFSLSWFIIFFIGYALFY